jgi:DNA polymerase-3 subunit delta'
LSPCWAEEKEDFVVSFKDILGHSMPIELLKRGIISGKVAQSYLFLGSQGIGKKWVALQFAKALNCLERDDKTGDGCDQCLSCRKINDGLHPDIVILEPENQTIKVDQVRQMQRDLAYKPYEGLRRVCILAGADRMAPNMSNILLKTLEEPPLHTVLVLLASNSRVMLPTIVSRCQLIRFNALPISVVAQWLVEQKGLPEWEARLLASLSEGSPGKALELQGEIGQIPRKELLMEWVGVDTIPFEGIERWIELLPSDRGSLVSLLEVAKTLVRDLVIAKIGMHHWELIHGDLREDIIATASKLRLLTLLQRMDSLHRTLLDVSPLRGNANTKLALEAMMLSWAQG